MRSIRVRADGPIREWCLWHLYAGADRIFVESDKSSEFLVVDDCPDIEVGPNAPMSYTRMYRSEWYIPKDRGPLRKSMNRPKPWNRKLTGVYGYMSTILLPAYFMKHPIAIIASILNLLLLLTILWTWWVEKTREDYRDEFENGMRFRLARRPPGDTSCCKSKGVGRG